MGVTFNSDKRRERRKIGIPQGVIDNWDSVYEGQVEDALRADPDATAQLLIVARVLHDPGVLIWARCIAGGAVV